MLTQLQYQYGIELRPKGFPSSRHENRDCTQHFLEDLVSHACFKQFELYWETTPIYNAAIVAHRNDRYSTAVQRL